MKLQIIHQQRLLELTQNVLETQSPGLNLLDKYGTMLWQLRLYCIFLFCFVFFVVLAILCSFLCISFSVVLFCFFVVSLYLRGYEM